MRKINIGILEFGYLQSDINSMMVIEEIFKYCELADKLGYKSFWLTEHHNFYKSSPWSTPDTLLPLLLANTEQIKIGVGGVLINYHSPYLVALNYKLLANIFPGRVHLGFSNGTPSLKVSQLLSQRLFKKRPDNYLKNIKAVTGFFQNEELHAQKEEILIPPFLGTTPDLYLLGSFCHNLGFALENNLNFCKSTFHDLQSLTESPDLLNRYRDQFHAANGRDPEVSFALAIICAKDEKKAKELASKAPIRPVVNTLIGCPNFVTDKILEIGEKYNLGDFIIADKSFHSEAKLDTLHLLNEKFNLNYL
ncbi:LLM class flavin-dependent oxidoreductase [Pedobacter sp. CFBP9032]|uniref:LLM class flavin-dependent oxidoreductase n=1 Tax=Pedobacter sp. CFBP9032 TaxID=3096539 RepID=UPI002A69A977|nr:LLM class flavin-dependent oxidoreductase [Pedobacter sp. CFBP9032]MDY0905130.1 LLM class flavin-dependent oxidoreductase [Pedobacter sp. CFBP9032]